MPDQQPLTPEGVSDKVSELYALPDNNLFAEAHVICADFRSWISANFSLDSDQKAYLTDLPDGVNFSFGAALAAVLIGRGNVAMRPLPDNHRRTKEIKCDFSGTTRYIPPRNGNPSKTVYVANLEFSFLVPKE